MQCRPSIDLALIAPKFDRPESESRRESDAARYALGLSLGNPSGNVTLVGLHCPNGYIVDTDMADRLIAVDRYIRQRDDGCGALHPYATVDWELPGHGYPININGVADCVGWNATTRTLYIDELKYGFRLVEVENNYQLIGYAIGAMLRYGYMPDRVVMTIYQPRVWHPDGPIRTWVIDRQQLADARLEIVHRFAESSGSCRTGRECYGCAATGICPSAYAAASAAIEFGLDSASDEIDNDRLGVELRMLENAEAMLKIRKKALSEMTEHRIKQGQSVKGWTLKESISNRKWIDGVSAAVIQQMTGIDVSDNAIVSPSQAEKKGVPKDIVNSFTVRTSGGFKLVQSDVSKDADKLFGG